MPFIKLKYKAFRDSIWVRNAGSGVPPLNGGAYPMTTETESQVSTTQGMLWLGVAIVVVVALAYLAM